MKPWTILVALLVAMSSVALAKPIPIEQPTATAIVKAGIIKGSVASVQENTGSIGAMREREYFEATPSPSPTPRSRSFSTA